MTNTTITAAEMAQYIDHTLLKPDATLDALAKMSAEAISYGFKAVCVNSGHVAYIAGKLQGAAVAACTVVGFPLGAMQTRAKAFEAENAVAEGAAELDMVLNIGQLRSGKSDFVRDDIQAVCEAAHARGAKVKVILENAYLSDDEKVIACQLCEAAGADWVKTSTGFAPGGATLEDLRLMRATVSDKVQVKAAGGVRTLDAILPVIDAGCTRVGATATAAILDEFERRGGAGKASPAEFPQDTTGY